MIFWFLLWVLLNWCLCFRGRGFKYFDEGVCQSGAEGSAIHKLMLKETQ